MVWWTVPQKNSTSNIHCNVDSSSAKCLAVERLSLLGPLVHVWYFDFNFKLIRMEVDNGLMGSSANFSIKYSLQCRQSAKFNTLQNPDSKIHFDATSLQTFKRKSGFCRKANPIRPSVRPSFRLAVRSRFRPHAHICDI